MCLSIRPSQGWRKLHKPIVGHCCGRKEGNMTSKVILEGTLVGDVAVMNDRNHDPFVILTLLTSSYRRDEDGVSRKQGGGRFSVLVFGDSLMTGVQDLMAYSKNPRVIVAGDLVFEDWQKGDKSGVNLKVIADHIGPSLRGQKVTIEKTPAGVGGDDESEVMPA